MRKNIKNIFVLLTIITIGSYLTLQAKERNKQVKVEYKHEVQSE